MPDPVAVFCGELARRGANDSDGIHLDVAAAEGTPERVNLRIDQITARMVAEISPRVIDLLEIASYVYAADQLETRGGDAMRGMGKHWRRSFRFSIPVRDFAFWQSREARHSLVGALSFLSDDDYDFDFQLASAPRPIKGYLGLDGDGAPSGFEPDHVVLFSGGLDSLSGVALGVLQRGEKLALVSHSASTAIQSLQNDLVATLRARCPEQRLFHVGVKVTRGTEEPREFTQRTRSFLFASLAFVVARLFRKSEITFFENGIVSVNLPIAEHVMGGRATRTTHPKTFSGFAGLFSLVAETDIRVTNPFFWLTKSEVVRKLTEAGAGDLIHRSFSCSHVRQWVRSGQQCGACTQCLDRRFAVLAAGLLAHDPAEGYGIDLLAGERQDGKDMTVAVSYVMSAYEYAGMTETAFFGAYGQLLRVLRHLDGDMNENASRLFDLHRRHGAGVCRVVDTALAETTLKAIRTLPKTCLLSLLRSSTGFGSETRRDPVEAEPPAREQAATSPVMPAPITLALDRRGRRAFVDRAIVLKGAHYSLIAALAEQRLRDQLDPTQTGALSFVASARLARELAIETETLRRRVLKCRRHVRKGLASGPRPMISDDAVIESIAWKGYRLSPGVHIGSGHDEDLPTTDPKITTSLMRSRHSRRPH